MKISRNTYKRILTIYVLKAWNIYVLHYTVKGNYLQVVNHFYFFLFLIYFLNFYIEQLLLIFRDYYDFKNNNIPNMKNSL